jgi:ATP-dependent exoDNAse (exonuclease V) beta subunit
VTAPDVRRPSDHDARMRALDPRHSFLVQAPAGSGKTELLTDRILALLATVAKPEEIVAITFTRKAASEMHARVLSKLRDGLGPEPAGENARRSWQLARAALARDAELGWDLLHHPARLSIRTIDAFCAGLVRSMPWLSELGGLPGIADDARQHYEAAAQATLDLAADFDAVRTLLVHLDVDVLAARAALADMLARRDQWLPLLDHGGDRDSLRQALADAISEDLQAVCAHMPPGWCAALDRIGRAAAAALDEADAGHPLAALRDWQGDLAPHSDALAHWKAVAHLLLTKDGGLRKTVDKRLGFPPKSTHKEPFMQWLAQADPQAPWVAGLGALREVPPAQFTDEQWQVLGAQLMALRLAAAQLRLRFSQAGEVDFIEIAQRARAALGSAQDPGELMLKLDAAIHHLLIDEFQDTSQAQIDLLAALTAGWQDGDGRTLFLVGDPMQSIYRFRKAEVGLFLDVRDAGVGEIRPDFLNLTDNFRSQAGVVEWINRTFSAMLPARDEAGAGAISYTHSTAFNAALDDTPVRFHAAWGVDGVASADEQAEAIVVDLVREALARRDPGSRHPVAVLVRARSHLGHLVRRLAHEGIRCRAVELVPLAQRHVVSDLVQLVRALTHPADRMAWLSVLRAPWCGLTLHSLHALFGHDHITPIPVRLQRLLREPDSGLPVDEEGRLRHAAEILLDDGNAAGGLPFAAWVESLWRRLGGAGLYASPSAAADAESLFLLVERLAPHGALDLARLDAGIEGLYATPEAGEDEDGVVEVMTMHKSKGLQFDTVILYGLHHAPRAERIPLVSFEQRGGRVLLGPVKPRAETEPDPISRYLLMREKKRAAYETDRLLYVAATRARHRLHLVGNVAVDPANGQARPPAPSSLLGRLWPWLDDAARTPPAGLPQPQAQDAEAAVRGEPLRRVTPQAMAKLLAQRSPVAPAEPETPWRGGVQHPDWIAETAHEAAIGTLAHAWLERMGRDGPAAWPESALRARLPAMRTQLQRAGVPAAHVDAAADIVLETLLATLAHERGVWLLGQAAARREWPLIDAGGRVSVIDLALSTEDGWLIVDYKTGMPHPGESATGFAARMRARHAEQLERYRAQVTAFDGRPARAALYFPRARTWLDL